MVIIIFALRWYLPIEKLTLHVVVTLWNSWSCYIAHPHGTQSVRMGPHRCADPIPLGVEAGNVAVVLLVGAVDWALHRLIGPQHTWDREFHMEQVYLLHVKDVENSCAGVCIPGFCFVLLLVPTIQCNEILQRHYENGIKRRNRLWPSSQKSTKG